MPSPRPEPDWSLEDRLWRHGYTPVAGLDEAGRGALAGPVAVAAVVLPVGYYPYRDSKGLSPGRRAELAHEIREVALDWCVALASCDEVDDLNVLAATKVAGLRALAGLKVRPAAVVTDYLTLAWQGQVLAVARADSRSFQVAAASILAKTERDRVVTAMESRFPGYEFARNKGYGTSKHLAALERIGPSRVHRTSFKPVAQGRLFAKR